MRTTFGPDTIRAMQKIAAANMAVIERTVVADHAYDALARAVPAKQESYFDRYGGVSAFAGVPITKSSLFPYNMDCSTCDGTGEGIESTYCPKCHGAGATRVVGMVQQGRQHILLSEPLPKKFQPRFPTGLVPIPSLVKGLT